MKSPPFYSAARNLQIEPELEIELQGTKKLDRPLKCQMEKLKSISPLVGENVVVQLTLDTPF